MHSTYSDGSDTPAELVRQAERANLAAIALTDHDTLDGIGPLLEAARDSKMRVIGGTELSLAYENATLHLLGYLVDPANEPLREHLSRIRNARDERNHQIAARLQELELPIDYEEVSNEAGGDVIGRPHFARVLMRKGIVGSFNEAFDLYLARGAKAYVDRRRLAIPEAIAAVREAGGVPVLAHPFLTEDAADPEKLRELLRQMTDWGLLGLEVWYTDHSEWQTAHYLELAREFGLLTTGGSDYHGQIRPDIAIGRGQGELRVPDEALDHVLAAAETDLTCCTNIRPA